VVPVSGMLNLKAVADALGGRRAVMADQVAAERATGYVVGGISPLAQKRALPVVLDETAILHDRIHVSAGRRGLEIAIGADDLLLLTRGILAPIARD
jgi:Cys-tRNA(Pro)/Cys-tRNA(Cys) deacylase